MSHVAFLPDSLLVARAVAGDTAAAGELVERFAPALFDLTVLFTDEPTAARLTTDLLVQLASGNLPAEEPLRELLLATVERTRGLYTHRPAPRESRRNGRAELASALAVLPLDDALALVLSVRYGLDDSDVAPRLGLDAQSLPARRSRDLELLRAAVVTRRSHTRRWRLPGSTLDHPAWVSDHIARCARCQERATELPSAVTLLAWPAPPLSRAALDDFRLRLLRALGLPEHPESGLLTPQAARETIVARNAGARIAPTSRRPVAGPPRRIPSLARLNASFGAQNAYGTGPPLRLFIAVATFALIVAAIAGRALPADGPGATAETQSAEWPTLPTRGAPPHAVNPRAAVPATVTNQVSAVPAVPRTPATATPVAVAREEPTPVAAAGPAPEPSPTPLSYAAARGAPLPAPPAPRAIGSPPATASTTTSPPPSPAVTNPLRVSHPDLAFGVETGPRTIEVSNSGNVALVWSATGNSTWLAIQPSRGVLPAGEASRITVTVDRGALPAGSYTAVVELSAAGVSQMVDVGMLVSPTRAVVTALDQPLAPINALGCASPTTASVAAEIRADAPPRRVVLYYALNGGTESSKPLVATGDRYATTLGAFYEPGTVIYSLVLTEADGTITRTAARSVTVQDCDTRVRVHPVTLPASRHFVLADRGHELYAFTMSEPGNIVAQLSWTGTAPRLSTLLYGPRHADQPYEQRTGMTALSFSFPVTPADVAAGGAWALHLVNYATGDATGTLVLTFEPRGVPIPTTAPTPPPASPAPVPTPTRLPARSTPIAGPATPPVAATPSRTPTVPRGAAPTGAPAPATPPPTVTPRP